MPSQPMPGVNNGIKKKSRFGPMPVRPNQANQQKKPGGFTTTNWAPVSSFDPRLPPIQQ